MTRTAELTERETEVLVLASEGCDRNEIAERLFISPITARNHLQKIRYKLGARNTANAVAIFAKMKLPQKLEED